jgi:hypothetical protein
MDGAEWWTGTYWNFREIHSFARDAVAGQLLCATHD